MADIPVILHTGATQSVLVKKTDTPKELIEQLYDDWTKEERLCFRVFEVRRSPDGVSQERQLKMNENLVALKADWDLTKNMVCNLVTVMLKEFIIVNFNTYFRMMAGVSDTTMKVYISPLTTVADVTDEVKVHLRLKAAETRFGLMGNYGAGREMRKLSTDEKVQKLKSAWETPENTYFQFQVLPDKEDQKRMGATKESFLEIGGFLPLWKRRWFSLRGTSLFYFKEKGDTEELAELPNLDKARVTAVGGGKKKGMGQKFMFRFDIELEDGKTIGLAAEDEPTMNSWVEAIKSCGSLHPARTTDMKVQQANIKRTFVPIGTAEAFKAGKNLDPRKAGEAEKEMEEVDKGLDEVKELCKDLPTKRGETMVLKTKELIRAVQSLVVKVSTLVAREEAGSRKKPKVEEHATSAKEKLKSIITAAKPVGSLPPDENEYNPQPQVLAFKKALDELVMVCEMLVLAFITDEDDMLVVENPWENMQPVQPPPPLKTGIAELDNLVQGFSSFGLTPELAEMMAQASQMKDADAIFDNAAASSSMSSSSSNPQLPPSIAADAPAAAAYDDDDGLNDILANLNEALSGI